MEYDIWAKTRYCYVCYDGNIFPYSSRMMSLSWKVKHCHDDSVLTMICGYVCVLLHFCQVLHILKDEYIDG